MLHRLAAPALLVILAGTAPRPPIPDKLVVLTFDDSSRSHFEVVRPLLKRHGFGATFFVTEGFDFPDNKTDYMTWDEIAELHRDGFEIGNHTRDHLAIDDETVDRLDEQLGAIEARCREHGIPAPVSFAWPANAITPEAFPILSRHGIRFARRGGAPEYPYDEGRGFAFEPGADHPLLLPSAGDARPTWSLDDLERAVSQARDGRVAILQFHGAPDTAHEWVDTPRESFEAFVEYLAAGGFEVIALRDLERYVDPGVVPADPFAVIERRKSAVEAASSGPAEWTRFRGPRGSGVFEAGDLPVELGPDHNVAWKAPLPPGHSSPVVAGDRLFLTGFEEEKLLTLAVRADDGQVLWQRSVERHREQRHHRNNNAASPTPVTDGESVYAFFADFGLVAYTREGEEMWRLPLGPFKNFQGVANSPVLAGDVLVQVCDQDAGSFMVLVEKSTGRVLQRVDRFGPSYSSPVVRENGDDCEVVAAGNGELAGYDCRTGQRLWWVGGLPYQPKSSPVVAKIDGQEIAVFHSQSIDDLEQALPPFPSWLAEHDADGDGRITPAELPFSAMFDSDGDGFLDRPEYEAIRDQARAPHTLLAVRLGGRGDLEGDVLWRDSRSIPNVPTPIVYRGILFVLKEGGILSSFDPLTGELHKRGRLSGALGEYYASPVASGGRLYLASLEGHVVVVRAEPQWEVERVASLEEPIFATPALAEGRLYVRTATALYCFSRVSGGAAGGR